MKTPIGSILAVLGMSGLFAMPACAGADVGAAVEVAPKVEGTKCQMWPRMAWNEGAKCWLLAWREGFPNQDDADIVCARVSSEGQTLDPAGIRVCTARGNQEWPTVATDGKDFLVAWEDMRPSVASSSSGRDWNVYAARISGEGKVLDPDGFLVAGGEHNQGRPCAVFAGGSYVVVWQGYIAETAKAKHKDYPVEGVYNLFATRISTDGKVLDAPRVPIMRDPLANMTEPAVAGSATGKTLVVAFNKNREGFGGWGEMVIAQIDAATCKLIGPVTFSPSLETNGKPIVAQRDAVYFNVAQRMPGLLMVDDESGLLAAMPPGGSANVTVLQKRGRFGSDSTLLGKSSYHGALVLLPSIAWDGSNALVVADWNTFVGKSPMDVEVRGWLVSGDGKVLDNPDTDGKLPGFVIADKGPQKAEMQGIGAAGPKGTFLVAYVELRALADTKVMARVVKVK